VATGIAFLCRIDAALADDLPCLMDTDSGPEWSTAYCDLSPSQNFSAGTMLHIKLAPGGSSRVMVRLLTDKRNAKKRVGIIGNIITVPSNNQIDLIIPSAQSHVEQISVHGGRKAWDIDLGQNNGDPVIERIWTQ
jgi:hypothetical protein